jgi:hypothetical protein
VIESVLAWAWRAGDLVAGKSVDQGEIDKAIRAERIKTET